MNVHNLKTHQATALCVDGPGMNFDVLIYGEYNPYAIPMHPVLDDGQPFEGGSYAIKKAIRRLGFDPDHYTSTIFHVKRIR